DGSDLHLNRNGCREIGCERNAFALERAEACKGERDRVCAWSKLDDLVLTRAVGNGRPRLLDQRGTGHLNRDTQEYRTGRFLHKPRNCAGLSRESSWPPRQRHDADNRSCYCAHTALLL